MSGDTLSESRGQVELIPVRHLLPGVFVNILEDVLFHWPSQSWIDASGPQKRAKRKISLCVSYLFSIVTWGVAFGVVINYIGQSWKKTAKETGKMANWCLVNAQTWVVPNLGQKPESSSGVFR